MRGFVAIAEVLGEQHAFHRQVQAGDRKLEQPERTQHPVVPDEAQSLDHAGHHAVGPFLGLWSIRAGQAQHGHGQDREAEGPGGDPHGADTAECRDEQTADTRPGDVGEIEHRLVDAVGVVKSPIGPTRRLGQHRQSCRHPGGIEEGPECGQAGQHHGVQHPGAHGQRQYRDRRDRQCRHCVSEHGHPAPAQEVDGGSGDQGGEQQRQGSRPGNDGCLGGASGALQHQPREGDQRDAIACRGQKRRAQDQQCGPP